ncbi:MAG TPA: tRNA pseudouridine(38-40) synthase TruA [candidate division Zixibacteria bacterium]|nr:tRNA pseudouridine(38-40) synthase TruA [candidate division Zixibacteria bacterium]
MNPSERNIRIIVNYDGTAFAGWQYQPDQRTVQGELCRAIKRVTGNDVNLLAAGRTDAGVHALGQVANFRIEHSLPAERFEPAVNSYLDDDIRVLESTEVSLDFHARFDAKEKRYRYLIGRRQSAVFRNQRWFMSDPVDFDRLQQAAGLVSGEHDFSAFCVTGSLKEDNHCRIRFSRWFRYGDLLIYEIRGNRFLHHMVRSLVGGMVNLAEIDQDNNRDNLTIERFADIITSPENERNVFTAPARGLYLVSVRY